VYNTYNTQETPCASILNKQKYIYFSFTESENRRVEQVLPVGVGTSGRWEDVGKGCGRVNTVQILCTHVCKWKNDTCKTIPGIGIGR
jgi:hypothetical protein